MATDHIERRNDVGSIPGWRTLDRYLHHPHLSLSSSLSINVRYLSSQRCRNGHRLYDYDLGFPYPKNNLQREPLMEHRTTLNLKSRLPPSLRCGRDVGTPQGQPEEPRSYFVDAQFAPVLERMSIEMSLTPEFGSNRLKHSPSPSGIHTNTVSKSQVRRQNSGLPRMMEW